MYHSDIMHTSEVGRCLELGYEQEQIYRFSSATINDEQTKPAAMGNSDAEKREVGWTQITTPIINRTRTIRNSAPI